MAKLSALLPNSDAIATVPRGKTDPGSSYTPAPASSGDSTDGPVLIDGSRVVFTLIEARHDEDAESRPVRLLPASCAGTSGAMLAYKQIDGSCRRSLMPGSFRPELFTAVKPQIQSVLRLLLREHGFHDLTDVDSPSADAASLIFCGGFLEKSPLDVRQLRPHMRVNRLPGIRLLSGKATLWQCYADARATHGEAHFSFCPEHFLLPKQMGAFEAHMRARLAAVGDGGDASGGEAAEAEGGVWILKPDGTFATFGNGIFLHQPTADSGWGGAVVTREVRTHRGVAAKYIDPPFLIDGLKFDLRIYVLITSVRPLAVYAYEEGLARFATQVRLKTEQATLGSARPLLSSVPFSSQRSLVRLPPWQPYSLDDLGERCAHLTNYTLNKHSATFEERVEEDQGSKWSLSALRRRLRTQLGAERAAAVWRDVDDLIVKTVVAAEPKLTEAMAALFVAAAEGDAAASHAPPTPTPRNFYNLLGFDVMLDAAAKPWLLEVNVDPSLGTDSPLDQRVKMPMLVDLLNVVGLQLPPAHDEPSAGPENAGAALATGGESSRRGHARHTSLEQSLEDEYQRSLGGRWRRLAGPNHARYAALIEAQAPR